MGMIGVSPKGSDGKWVRPRTIVALGLLVLATGCSPSSDDSLNGSYTPSDASEAITALYQSDVSQFPEISHDSIAAFDKVPRNNHIFRKIFGGVTGDAVAQYYQERVHYAYTQEQIGHASVSPGSFPINGWATVKPESEMPEGSSPPHFSPTGFADTFIGDTNSNIKIGAINISTMLWLQGQVNDTQVTLFVGDDTIPIDSTRVGVIMLDVGYTPTVTDRDGDEYNIPALRQAILVHEARHSDCTGGLSSQTLKLMRSADSSQDFYSQQPRNYCGHTHIVCTTGAYEGLSACDSEQYGAYTIGAIYEAALINSLDDDVEKSILSTSAVDYLSRFVDTGAPQTRDEEVPDMSSEGVTH